LALGKKIIIVKNETAYTWDWYCHLVVDRASLKSDAKQLKFDCFQSLSLAGIHFFSKIFVGKAGRWPELDIKDTHQEELMSHPQILGSEKIFSWVLRHSA
jgi:hypothetical protein